MTKGKERAVITVVGQDQVGILAKVATSCASATATSSTSPSLFWTASSAW